MIKRLKCENAELRRANETGASGIGGMFIRARDTTRSVRNTLGFVDVPVDLDDVIRVLREAGARFAYLHGSRTEGRERVRSDVDIAAYFGAPVDAINVSAALPGRVDLLVLDGAPLELAGRVALRGELLFYDDPVARVRWEALTRRIYSDELPRIEQARRDFVAATRAHGRR